MTLEKLPILTEAEIEEKLRKNSEWERQREAFRESEEESRQRKLRGIPLARHAGVTPKPWQGGFLHGPPGVGKTREAIARLLSVYGVFVGAIELVAIAREIELDRASEYEESRWKWINRAEHLVLDDLGTRRPSAFASETILTLVDDRWNGMRETLVTSNLSPPELGEAYDTRILSRIVGFGPVERMEGPDRRLKGSPKNFS